jgi:heme a synthase
MRKLLWITVGMTYLLMVWGNLVSSTGSGLACPDWPLCHGTIAPAISGPVILEWGHRLLAFVTGILIISSIFSVFRAPAHTNLRKSGKSLLVLLGLQVLLGGTTVLVGLSPVISTVHLLIAAIVFGGLIAVACVVTWKDPEVEKSSPKLRRLAVAGLIGLIIQLCLGALVRHTHSGLACPNFPNCLTGFFPLPFGLETALAFLHRWWGVLMLGLFFHLAMTATRQTPALGRSARRIFSLSVAQVILGVGTVMSGLQVETRAIHAAIGYALWGLLFFVAIRAGSLKWLWEDRTA